MRVEAGRTGERGDIGGGGSFTNGVKMDRPFDAWASVIVDGRVVATDHAPDNGWLLPSPGATPGGTYVVHGVDGVPLRISMNLPPGWSRGGAGVSRPTGDEDTTLQFMIIDEPLTIGCDNGDKSEVPVGPSVDDLVTVLEGLQPKKVSEKTTVALKISENTDVTVDGYRGRYLEYTATVSDVCNVNWPIFGNQTWILDVDGVRLVIDASAPTASETAKAEIQEIVDSIHIGP